MHLVHFIVWIDSSLNKTNMFREYLLGNMVRTACRYGYNLKVFALQYFSLGSEIARYVYIVMKY